MPTHPSVAYRPTPILYLFYYWIFLWDWFYKCQVYAQEGNNRIWQYGIYWYRPIGLTSIFLSENLGYKEIIIDILIILYIIKYFKYLF